MFKVKKNSKETQKSQISQGNKDSRFSALYQTSLYILETRGSIALLQHFYAFMKGQRLNTVIIKSESDKRLKTETELYEQWLKKYALTEQLIKEQKDKEKNFSYRPLISILTPVFNTDKKILEKMLRSVLSQTYSNWELCLADGASTKPETRTVLNKYAGLDKRIKVEYLTHNLGIAGNSNEAYKIAKGEFLALLDHDDELPPDALYEVVSHLNKDPEVDFIYSDEDKLDAKGKRCDPHFKPDWSIDLFRSMMYTCHLGIYRKSIFEKAGGFRSGFDGAQDYDLVLRIIEQTNRIYHIPKILYHWRKTEGSTSTDLSNKDYAKSAQIKAVSEHFQRLQIKAEVLPGLADNLLYPKRILDKSPKISIIIPTKDQITLLRNCIDSIVNTSNYENYEILIVNNNSEERSSLEYFERIVKKKNIDVIDYNHPFNFAAINNYAVKRTTGEILLFLNNDTEVISENWLEAMVEQVVRPEVGAVGARLLYTDGRVQHAGVILGIGGVAGHSHKYYQRNHPGYFSRALAVQNLSAVTAACMMMRRDVFNDIQGFNEKYLPVAFNDVDICLRIRKKSLLIVYTPYAELYHHESISRGADETPEKVIRFQQEVFYMLENWTEELKRDPYYNVNLSLIREDFSIVDLSEE